MGLDELKPGNTKRAKDTAISAFMAFAKSEYVEFDYVKQCIEQDGTGKKGKALARNTAMQYFRHSKMWMFELFPVQRHIVEAKLFSMGKTLNIYCMKRDGKLVNKAPPCSKSDLKKMMLYLYQHARLSCDYQDAALLCLLWYLFGRASDLSLVCKQNISIDAAEVFFVRFIRMKTSEEQGLSLFPGSDFVTCPLHAIAVAIITQTAPNVSLIDNLPEVHVEAAVNLFPVTPLVDVLDHPDEFTVLGNAAASTEPAPAAPSRKDTTPTIYTHVNRVLDRIANRAGVVDALTSHSFRRGGAQHVNGCHGLTHRWIFDRGAWNMSATNKGFNYIFNTSREDHKVSKALSGYSTEAEVKALNLKPFDAETQEKIAAVQGLLFTTCYKMESSKYNLSQRVVDVLTAYLILHYPQMKELLAEGLVVRRIETAVVNAGSSIAELLAWSSHLASSGTGEPNLRQGQTQQPPQDPSNASKIIDHQRRVVDQLMQHIKRQDERMRNLEAKVDGNKALDKSKKRQQESSQDQEKPKRRRGSATHLHATWFAWYAHEPRMWEAPISKQQKADAKLLVAFMKLFLSEGFNLDIASAGYRDRVLELGQRAEDGIYSFLAERDIMSRGSSAVLKHLRALHRTSDLNKKIERHQRLLQTAAIRDPAPGYKQDVLETVRQ